jgi:hypothetical protein
MRNVIIIIICLISSIAKSQQLKSNSPNGAKINIIKKAIDTIVSINKLNINYVYVIPNCYYDSILSFGGTAGYRIRPQGIQILDDQLYRDIRNNYKMVDYGTDNVVNFDGIVENNLRNENAEEYSDRKFSIIVETPLYTGWAILDMIDTMITILPKEKFLYEYDKYKSTVLCLPVLLVNNQLKPSENSAAEYIIKFHLFLDDDFNNIYFKIEDIISLGGFWK